MMQTELVHNGGCAGCEFAVGGGWCGDNECNSSEDSSTCPTDCGNGTGPGPIACNSNNDCAAQSICKNPGTTSSVCEPIKLFIDVTPHNLSVAPGGSYTYDTIVKNSLTWGGNVGLSQAGGPSGGSFGPVYTWRSNGFNPFAWTLVGINGYTGQPATASSFPTCNDAQGCKISYSGVAPSTAGTYVFTFTVCEVYPSTGVTNPANCARALTTLDVAEPVPPPPTGLSVTPSVTPSACGQDWLNISWNASAGAVSYQIYRDGGTTPVYDGPLLAFSDTGLTLGSTHSYTVAAKNLAGVQSPLSGSVSNTVAPACGGPIPPPTTTSVTCNSGTSATINYTLPAGYTSANIRVNKNSATCFWPAVGQPDEAATQPGAQPGNPSSYNFSVVSGQQNCYWVETVDGTQNPTYSAAEGFHTFSCPVAPPTVVLETPASGASVSGTILVKGYAVPVNSITISRVELWTASTPGLAATSNSASVSYYPGFFPVSRTDLATTFGPGGTTPRSAYPNIGFNYPSLDTRLLSNGPHHIIMEVYDSANNHVTLSTPITVNNLLAPTVDLTANANTPAPMIPTLTWVVGNSATTCTASGAWSGSKASADGSHNQTLAAISVPTTYTITCSNAVGSAVDSVTVSPTGTGGTLNVTTTYGGYITDDQGGINCGTTCSHTYSGCPDVILTPNFNSPQFKFIAWTGVGTNTASCPIAGVGVNHTCTVNVCTVPNANIKSIFTLVPIQYKEF